ncbi:MAG: hypothetical protein IJC56_00570, partial [Clostridia bacterium]|nr:hypothetical protein [Clostridia bacterium]
MKKSCFSIKVLTAAFLGIVFFFSATNFDLIIEPVRQIIAGEVTVKEFISSVQDTYRADIDQKEDFVTLNGAYARASGIQISNNVILMKNGMLTEVQDVVDTTYASQKVTELYRYLYNEGVEFLYLQSPRKPDMYNELLPTGTVNGSNETANSMVNSLTLTGVPLIDLRYYVSANAEMLGKYFYKTDHHWNAEGAFEAFRVVTEYLQAKYPGQQITSEATDRNNWTLHRIEDHFMGSHGRRVGAGYAGIEDLIYLTPDFGTAISCAVPSKYIYRYGSFENSVLDRKFIEMEPDYYNTNPYCVHTGGDYDHVIFRNANAKSDLKVLLVKDSFGLPFEGFLSTVFKEVDTLDFRHYTDGTLVEEIEFIDPDIVIVMYNPSLLANTDALAFGVENAAQVKAGNVEQIVQPATLNIEAEDRAYNWRKVATLQPGTNYTITVEDINVNAGDSQNVQCVVYDFGAEQRLDSTSFDIQYARATGKGYSWTFRTPDTSAGELGLLVYAGVPGKTNGVSVTYENLAVYTGKYVSDTAAENMIGEIVPDEEITGGEGSGFSGIMDFLNSQIEESTPEPTAEPTAEPTVEPTAEPTAEPT